MITRLFVITILWSLGLTNFVYAEWQATGSTQLFSHYVDPGSINKIDHLAKIWVLDDYKVPQKTLDGKPFLSVRTREEYDCKKEKVRTHSVIVRRERACHQASSEEPCNHRGPISWQGDLFC